jgi:predicted short-subunit dehydrogenase-like oxidoreductase (DUF2520 family)
MPQSTNHSWHKQTNQGMEPYDFNNEKMVFIGAGNVATHLSKAIKGSNFRMWQVFSRNVDNAKALANKLKCNYTTDIKAIKTDADVYFFSVPDDALPAIIAEIPPNDGLWVHTAGSVPIDVFHGYTKRYGVLYPLQTFSKHRELDFSEIPLFIEANSFDDDELLYHIACSISDYVENMNSEKRKYLHLAAVFACNFSNHMYAIASHILEKQGIDWSFLLPLISETVGKIYDIHPDQAQTGPAVRFDRAVMEQHLSMLADEHLRQLYSMISESIQTNHKLCT